MVVAPAQAARRDATTGASAMNVVVMGADGQLGTEVMKAFGEHDVEGLTLPDCDITREDDVMQVITNLSPDLVVNCAAYTAVDKCEADPDPAWRVNALGPWWLAKACVAVGASMVHIST